MKTTRQSTLYAVLSTRVCQTYFVSRSEPCYTLRLKTIHKSLHARLLEGYDRSGAKQKHAIQHLPYDGTASIVLYHVRSYYF